MRRVMNRQDTKRNRGTADTEGNIRKEGRKRKVEERSRQKEKGREGSSIGSWTQEEEKGNQEEKIFSHSSRDFGLF